METVACDLCGSDRIQVVLRQRDLMFDESPEEFTVVRCTVCALLYLNPRPTRLEIGRYYPAQYYPSVPPKLRTGFEQSLKRVSTMVKRWIMEDFYGYPSARATGLLRRLRKLVLWPEKARRVFQGRDIFPWIGQGRLLDVGCGYGGNLATLQGQGWDVYGIDMSETAAAQARERVGDRIHVGALESAPFGEESFDLVFLSHALEHFFSPAEALARVRRLLKPNGMVVIAVPNAGSLEAKLFGPWWVPWDPPRHLYHFDQDTLSRLLERAGFHVVRIRTGVGPLFFMASLERVWKHKYGGMLPGKRLIEKLIVRPLCLAAGHLGYGTEITVYAVKAQPAAVRGAGDTSVVA